MSLPEPTAAPPALRRPASPRELFVECTKLALQGFGGVLAVTQRAFVERLGWLTREQFVEMLSLAQVLPGPNVVNLALMIGDRFFGTRGALAALAGMLLVPSLIVLALTASYAQFSDHPVVSSALRSMGAVAAGLITATALKLMVTIKRNALGLWVCGLFTALTFVLVAVLRWPLVWVVFGLGGCAMAAAAWRLRGRAP
jgi:chromate transporter